MQDEYNPPPATKKIERKDGHLLINSNKNFGLLSHYADPSHKVPKPEQAYQVKQKTNKNITYVFDENVDDQKVE